MKAINTSSIAVYVLAALSIAGIIYGIVMAATGHFQHTAGL